MAKKKKSWFSLLRKFFNSDKISGTEKKDKGKRWATGRFRHKKLACLSAPSPEKKRIIAATEKDKEGYAENGIIDNAVSETSHSNAQDYWFNGSPKSSIQGKKESQQFSPINVFSLTPQSHECELEIQHLAAIKIQSAFRGFLARKALRALKGLVRLQAMIRGWSVRRQAISTLKCLQTIVNIQSEFCGRRCDLVKSTLHNQENNLQNFTEKDIKIDTNSQRRWDDGILSRDEANALSMNKRAASIKRERIKKYWLTQQMLTESEQSKLNVKQRYWLEQWVDSQLAKSEDLQNRGTAFSANARAKEEIPGGRIRLRNLHKQYQVEELDSPINDVPRRSFHRRERSNGDDGSFLGSPTVPTYMAATESAKAKVVIRSMSSPRLRPICFDAYSDISSPYNKHKLSPISSINSEVKGCSQISKPIGFSQRSPCLKSIPGPVKPNRSLTKLNMIRSDVNNN